MGDLNDYASRAYKAIRDLLELPKLEFGPERPAGQREFGDGYNAALKDMRSILAEHRLSNGE